MSTKSEGYYAIRDRLQQEHPGAYAVGAFIRFVAWIAWNGAIAWLLWKELHR